MAGFCLLLASPRTALRFRTRERCTSRALWNSYFHCWRPSYYVHVNELVFEVTPEADGGYCAECLTESIFTEGDTWDELRRNVVEAAASFFFDRPRPERIRLRIGPAGASEELLVL